MKRLLLFIIASLSSWCLGMENPSLKDDPIFGPYFCLSKQERKALSYQASENPVQARMDKIEALIKDGNFTEVQRNLNSGEPLKWQQLSTLIEVAKRSSDEQELYHQVVKSLGYSLTLLGICTNFLVSYNDKQEQDRYGTETTYLRSTCDYAKWFLPKLLFMGGVWLAYKERQEKSDSKKIGQCIRSKMIEQQY